MIGWVQEPTLDRRTNTVYWAMEGSTSHGPVVNSIALRLGRNGYERLNWIADKADYSSVGGQLDLILRVHSFDPGYRYSDHQQGDRTALYGIAGLVAAVAGAKAVKVAAGVGVAALAKKFGAILVAATGACLYYLKSLFRRSSRSSRPPSNI